MHAFHGIRKKKYEASYQNKVARIIGYENILFGDLPASSIATIAATTITKKLTTNFILNNLVY